MNNNYKESFEQIKIAGCLAAEALDEVTSYVKPGVTTDKLDKDTLNEIIWYANESMIIMKNILNADGYNFGANIGAAGGAGIEDHIHFHVVPRWNGDTNFMPVIGETKVQVQGLQETYNELKTDFDKIMDNI